MTAIRSVATAQTAHSLPDTNDNVSTLVAGLPAWAGGVPDVVNQLERLVDTDLRWAVDLLVDGHARQAASLICAVLGSENLSTKRDVFDVAVDLLDAGMSLLELSAAVMRLPIWGSLANHGSGEASDLQIANYLLTTAVGHAPDADVLDQALAALTSGPVGDFLWHLTELIADQVQVDLVGLLLPGFDLT